MIAEAIVGITLSCFPTAVLDAYVRMDTAGLRSQLAAAASREESLLVRYRLYALAREKSLLQRIPEDLEDGSGRELALLSALWAYRIPGSAPWNVVSFGRRSVRLLDRALEAAPDDPLVRIVEAQSLLFRPAIAGGDVRLAIQRLRELRPMVGGSPGGCGVSPVEVEAWLWYGLRKAGDREAEGVRRRLLAVDPPPLFRAFVGADTAAASPF